MPFSANLEMTMGETKPTRGARQRFESLAGMRPARVMLGTSDGESEADGIDATIVDISSSCMCLRVPMKSSDVELMRDSAEGDFVEVLVSESSSLYWTVLGHLAWVWVPTMEKDDVVGSLGVDIAGVVENDERWVGKLRRLVSRDREIEVDRTARHIESPAQSRLKTASKNDDGATEGS